MNTVNFNIIISHKKKYQQKWLPFENDKRDIKKIVRNAWDSIKGSPHYLKFKKQVDCELEVDCEYPKNRPINPDVFELYYGCIFDFDAYDKSQEDYLVKEIESLPDSIFAAGISKLMNFTSIPKVKSLFSMPIYNEDLVKRYLLLLLILIRATNDENFNTALDEITVRERDILRSEHLKRSCGESD